MSCIDDEPASDPSAPMMLRRLRPAGLEGLVTRISAYRENGVALSNSVEMAPMTIPLVIGLGESFSIALDRNPSPGETYGSFVSGLHPGFVSISSTGRAACLQVDLTPLGAYRLMGMPLRDISGRMVGLGDLADRALPELVERIAGLADWASRLDVVHRFLLQRIGRPEQDGQAVQVACRTILAAGGNMKIGRLAERLGWSRKHLNERFRIEVGLGPKEFARMARFNRALDVARNGAGRWADIAVDCGYADQAHLVREFRVLAGRTPGELGA